jgi:hypothetical protein
MRRWRLENCEYIKAYSRDQSQKLTDNIVRGMLARNGLPRDAIPGELIEAKRATLRVQRLLLRR